MAIPNRYYISKAECVLVCVSQTEDFHSVHHTRGEGPEEKEALTISNESRALSTVTLYFTSVIFLVGKRPVLVSNQTGDFHNMQGAAWTSTVQ